MATAYATKVTAIPAPPSAGDIFWVDGIAGSDTNTGRSPLDPLEKIATALGLCTADHDDYIYVLDCWQQDTFPISVDKSRVHIIGIDVGNGKYPRMDAPTDTAIFDIAAEYFEIAGLSLNAGASHGAIEFNASLGRGLIRNCWFGRTGAGQDGILVAATYDAPEMLIEDCAFGTGLTRDGVRIAGNMTRGIIKNCLFFKVAGIGVNVTNAMALGSILSNRFVLPSDTQGKAITLAASTSDVFVDDNHANFGDTDMAANPYEDGAAAGSNHWTTNYKGITLIQPV